MPDLKTAYMNLAASMTAMANDLMEVAEAMPDTDTAGPGSVPAIPAQPAPLPVTNLPGDINPLLREFGIVYEYGDLFKYPAPNGGQPHADYVVSGQTIHNHYWGSRWYNGPFTIKNKVADLVAAKLIPPFNKALTNIGVHAYAGSYDAQGLPNRSPAPQPFVYLGARYMGQTGDTPSIGAVTEYHAAYMATEDASLVESIGATARDLLILPIHVRDPKTGQPINYQTYPGFSTYAAQENSMIDPSLRTGIIGCTPDGLAWDGGHSPSLWFLPFLLTDDPLWLEEGQLQCSFMWANDMPSQGHVGNQQAREIAWSMRDLIQTIIATRYAEEKGLIRSYHLSSQYFIDTMLTPTLKWFSTFFGDTSPAGYAKTVNWWGGPMSYAPWQFDFLTMVVGWGVWNGIDELRPLFDWLATGLVTRLSGANGWSADCSTFYYLANPTEDWASSFAALKAQEPRAADAILPGHTFIPMLENDYSDYVGWEGAAARMGKLIGHAGLTPLSVALDAKIKTSGIPVNYRHAIGST